MKKLFLIPLSVLFFLLALSFYDYLATRRTYSHAGPSQVPTISLNNPPASVPVGDLQLSWRLDSSTPRLATSTTIYWDNLSSPSALISTDSPAAVGYSHSVPDYLDGSFQIPAEFSAGFTFVDPQTIYYRGYAKIEGQHYWTPEYRLDIR